MIIKSATIFCLIALAHSATIRQTDIPVEIRYDANKLTGTELNVSGEDAISNDILKSSGVNVAIDVKNGPVETSNDVVEESVNVEQKPVVIIDESVPFKKLPEDVKIEEVPQKIVEIIEEKKEESKPAQDEPSKIIIDVEKSQEQKVQVLPEEPAQELKTVISQEKVVEVKPVETVALKTEEIKKEPVPEAEKKVEADIVQPEPNMPEPNDMQLRGIASGIMSGVQQIVNKKEEVVSTIVEKTEEKLFKPTSSVKYESLLVQAQEIVAKGLKQLKESVTLKADPKPVDWEILEKRVDAYFNEEKRKLQTKEEQQPPTNENFFTNIVNSIQSITSGFLQGNPQGQGSNPVSGEGEGTGGGATGGAAGGATGPLNNFISFINQGKHK